MTELFQKAGEVEKRRSMNARAFIWFSLGFAVAFIALEVGEGLRVGSSPGRMPSNSLGGQAAERPLDRADGYERRVSTKGNRHLTLIRGPHMRVVTAEGEGKLIFVSGQVAFDEEGRLVGVGDFERQARQAFANVKTALAAAGAEPGDVVQVKTYLTDRRNVPILRKVREEFFAGRVPASTNVQVAGLNQKDFLIEVEVIAFR